MSELATAFNIIALHGQLDSAQCQIDQERTKLFDLNNQYKELQESMLSLQKDHETLGIALDQARELQTTAVENQMSEKKKRVLREAALLVEIRTLWKLVEELRPVQSDIGTGQLATVRQLLQNCQEQEQTIQTLNATVEHYKALLQPSEREVEFSHQNFEGLAGYEERDGISDAT
ncbi:hypothetical protein AJ79_09697 [Helicocarpus griseus UAMH5409]|uniref:Uncharacterized protein n=1 Tax=Helicocarpus griseus UAMH5409 TaxID=1447875 RepID=A0A2B7WHS9_9EURO|nr:hypothetical protein AJ79_09697 [Helicocarpus griseus UAMH5409]